jgi:hypothetical protein
MPAVAESLNRVFCGSRRKHTARDLACVRAAPHSRRSLSIYLINNEYFNASVRLLPSKLQRVGLVAFEKLATGTYLVITKFNKLS